MIPSQKINNLQKIYDAIQTGEIYEKDLLLLVELADIITEQDKISFDFDEVKNKVSAISLELHKKIESIKIIKGEPGRDGYIPIKGIDYFDGKDGYIPVKGKDYFDGEPGGKGEDGSPDSPEQIQRKILALKDREWLPAYMIKGLPHFDPTSLPIGSPYGGQRISIGGSILESTPYSLLIANKDNIIGQITPGVSGSFLLSNGASVLPSYVAANLINISGFNNDAGYLTDSDLDGYVPYLGATDDVDIGTHDITANNAYLRGDLTLKEGNRIYLDG